MIVSKRTFRALYIPILIEQLFILIMGQADTLMLNSYSTDAVAAGNDKPNTHAHHVSNYNHSCGYKHTYCSLEGTSTIKYFTRDLS